jgi:hypothetical protein
MHQQNQNSKFSNIEKNMDLKTTIGKIPNSLNPQTTFNNFNSSSKKKYL